MEAIRQIYDKVPATIDVPPELQDRRVEFIMLPLDAEKPAVDANGWPLGYFEETFGSIPDFPEREPHSC
jgi:hypothetical protein